MQTIKLKKPVSILSTGTVAGVKEGLGPLSRYYDEILKDAEWDEKTWEKTESKMQTFAVNKAMEKAGVSPKDVDYIFAGDLLNQCIASSFGLRSLEIPFFGLYGACSTMGESAALASMTVSSGYASLALAVTSSHFCTAERQYRQPLEYGGQRPPSAQWTVTGSGAMLLGTGKPPYITHITTGKIVDKGINDANNMGAAMAPAAIDTLTAHFKDTGRNPEFYDMILTGDLGKIGKEIVIEKMSENGYDLRKNYNDCGCMVFDIEKQDMHAGGSGCGCGAITLCGYVFDRLQKGTIKNVLFVATGALLSPTSTLQGETIPGIAHAVAISREVD